MVLDTSVSERACSTAVLTSQLVALIFSLCLLSSLMLSLRLAVLV